MTVENTTLAQQEAVEASKQSAKRGSSFDVLKGLKQNRPEPQPLPSQTEPVKVDYALYRDQMTPGSAHFSGSTPRQVIEHSLVSPSGTQTQFEDISALTRPSLGQDIAATPSSPNNQIESSNTSVSNNPIASNVELGIQQDMSNTLQGIHNVEQGFQQMLTDLQTMQNDIQQGGQMVGAPGSSVPAAPVVETPGTSAPLPTQYGSYYDQMHTDLNNLAADPSTQTEAPVNKDASWWINYDNANGESSLASTLQNQVSQVNSALTSGDSTAESTATAQLSGSLVQSEQDYWIAHHPGSGAGSGAGSDSGSSSGGTGGDSGTGASGSGSGGTGDTGTGTSGTTGGDTTTGAIPPPPGSTAYGGLNNASNEKPDTKPGDIGGNGGITSISATQAGPNTVNFSMSGAGWGDGLWLTSVKNAQTEQNTNFKLQLNTNFSLTASQLANDHEIEKDIVGPWGVAGTQINPQTGEVDFWNAAASKWVNVGSLGPLEAGKNYNLQIGLTTNGNPDSGTYTFDNYTLNGQTLNASQNTFNDKNLGWAPGIYIQTQLDLPGSPTGAAGMTESGQTLYVSTI